MPALAAIALLLSLAPPQRWVTDDAQALSAAARERLDTRLAAYERQSGHQLLVYLGRTTGGVPVEDLAARTFAQWRPGRAGLDDGAVLFVFVEDRVARLEVGYGLEEKLTDAASARVLREVLLPRLAAGDADGAVAGAVEAIIEKLGAAPASEEPWRAITPAQWALGAIAAVLFLGLLIWKPRLAWLLLMFLARGRRGGGGGYHGGGGRSGGAGATGRW
jgi:uncharacterized protein